MVDRPPYTHAQLKRETAVKPHPSQTELQKIDQDIGIVHLITGTTARGEDFYAYLSIRPTLYDEFVRKTVAGERIDVDAFGEVLRKGFGKDPGDDVRRYMTKKYGIDHDFMKHLAEELEKRRKAKE